MKPLQTPRSPRNGAALRLALLVSLFALALAFRTWAQAPAPGVDTLKGKSIEKEATPSVIDLGPVELEGDADADGMPDSVEEANGTDPNDPADADGDADSDGLSNGDEVAMNLNARAADSDGDGIPDGEEVRLGYDPDDPASTPPAMPVVTSIRVTPAAATLALDDLVGQEPLRLRVTGELSDGTTTDLTIGAGTAYESGDTSIALVDGAGTVVGLAPGTTEIRLRNGGQTAVVSLAVTEFSAEALSFLSIPGAANGVDVQGDYAYVAAGQAGLVVVDARDLRAPRIAGIADTPGNANDVKVVGDYAFVADGARGLQVVDVRDPLHPDLAGGLPLPGRAADLVVRNGRAYVAAGARGLQIVDVSLPAAPVLLGGIDTPGDAKGVDADGALAVVADGDRGLEIFDVGEPAAPRLLGSTATRLGGSSHAADVVLRGRLAYVADGAIFNLGGLRAVDVGVPSTPFVAGATDDGYALTAVAVDGPLALGADILFANAVPVFDVGGRVPSFARAVDFSSAPSFRDDNGTGVAAQGGIVYMTGNRGLEENAAVADGGLHIGRYRSLEDEGGVPPRAAITAPAAGSTAPERSPLTVMADASDDVLVAAVEFLVDGRKVAVDSRAPFQAVIEVPAGVPGFVLGAVAVDYGGNRGAAAPVAVQVVPDMAPRVEMLAPRDGDHFPEGVTLSLTAHATDDVQVERVELFVDGASQGVATSPPYQVPFRVPVGLTPFTVEAEATDSMGQTARTAPVVVGVDDDPSPLVSIVAPTAATPLVAGSLAEVGIGASDDQQVTRVDLSLDGQYVASAEHPPYKFRVRVPAAASLVLTATATDNLGQQTTTEAVFNIVPDSGTTAEGRVVDGTGRGVAGAAVVCDGVAGGSDSDGLFSIPGVPAARGRISCGASVAGGLEGRSEAVDPRAGEITRVGDIALSGTQLYLAAGNGSDPFHPGRLLVLDGEAGRLLPWGGVVSPYGLSGLAIDGDGGLVASTVGNPPPFVGDAIVARRKRRPAAALKSFGTEEGSRILRLDPDSGAILATIGPLYQRFGPQVAIQDLVFDPRSGRTFALDRQEGVLYALDLEQATANPIAFGIAPGGNAALALGPDGLLRVLASSGSGLTLSTVDPADGRLLVAEPVSGSADPLGGMTLRPATGTYLVTSGTGATDLYELDPIARTLVPLAAPGGGGEGALLGLAFRPLAAEAVETTLTGLVTDATGAPLEGAEVTALGASGTTGAGGRFELPGVRVRTGSARVSVRSGPDQAFSAAVPPVPNGFTELGTVVLGRPVCVRARLYTNRCQSNVTSTLDLLLEEPDGSRTPVEPVFPDESGRFCLELRPFRRYFLRKEDLPCFCGITSACEAGVAVSDPGASGSCGDPDAQCQDLGYVQMQCDFFCGGS